MIRLVLPLAAALAASSFLVGASASAASAAAISSPAAQSGPVTQEATGRGASAAEARKEAIVAALRQIVGEYVEVDVQLADDEVVKNEILSFSNAGGVKSEQVGDPRMVGDEVEITMRVTVEPKPLVARVKGAAKAGARLDGAALAAEIAAAKDDYAARKRVLEKTFANLPDAFMRIRIVDSEGKDTTGVDRKLVEVDKKTGEATITIPVVLGFDMALWKRSIHPALEQVLKAASVRTLETDVVMEHDQESWSRGFFKYTRTPVKPMKLETGGEPWRGAWNKLGEGNVLLGLEREDLGRGRQIVCSVYEIEAGLLPFLSERSVPGWKDPLPEFNGLSTRQLRIRLLDAAGETVDGANLNLSTIGRFTLPPTESGTLEGLESANPHVRVLSPMISGHMDGNRGQVWVLPRWQNSDYQRVVQASEATVTVQLRMSPADLEVVEKIEVELFGPGGTN